MREYNLNILGTEWTVVEKSKNDDKEFERFDGYTDRNAKLMVIRNDPTGIDPPPVNYANYVKEVKRHEIIHAFLYESGLGNEMTHPEAGHDEQQIDWIAMQFPKMIKAFEEADAL